ncbi:hypothetical protein EEB12_26715 [Rhodococcus sp. WS1]|uniref:hypothetical protein n=1 Tax=unclassified Rhodococcus (in: high G+C Gram-positive bacteria) TaxID=192944 RepID=UPI001143FCED|nr:MULTISPECIES: hypothetical protein [unclassified Rhodococcus (in: high G+C Gram-positive bacteria)]ROZ53523.1 hypothetical protein EEB12_26715 [Rhodococcus sp. WS1]TQC36771.1 hypothetical protein EEB16_16710 [Rhodococcus sp. WS7]
MAHVTHTSTTIEPLEVALTERNQVNIRFAHDLNLTLSIAESVDLITELALTLGEAEGEEIRTLVRDESEIRTAAEIREAL